MVGVTIRGNVSVSPSWDVCGHSIVTSIGPFDQRQH